MHTVIHGTPPSKSNSYRIAGNRLYKTKALQDYESSFFIQCNLRKKRIGCYFKIEIDVYYPSERADLDNSLKVVMDCLQECGAIVNDRKCVEIIARKFKDPRSPRIEFTLTPLQNVEVARG